MTASQSSGFHAQGQAVAGDGGVVDQDVEAAEFFDYLLEAGFYLLLIGYVHFYGEGFAARGGDFLDQGD